VIPGIADPVVSAFAPIIGTPAWLVRRGFASFLTFEFGEPHLEVREPIAESNHHLLRQRRVTVRGDWHLWIHSCNWRVIVDGAEIAHNESSDQLIDAAASALDGQLLLGVEVQHTAACRFLFDLEGRLETFPYDDDDRKSDQWLLFGPDGNVLTLRGDAHYRLGPGNLTPAQEVWIPLQSSA
jgi:hypothetical protein